LLAIALWALCVLAATAGHAGGTGRTAVSHRLPPAATGILSPAADPAVLPARITDDVRAATQGGGLRALAIAAVFAALVGVPATRRCGASAEGHQQRPLRTRRHSIVLRAPPPQLA
jgi:hypothetical protein